MNTLTEQEQLKRDKRLAKKRAKQRPRRTKNEKYQKQILRNAFKRDTRRARRYEGKENSHNYSTRHVQTIIEVFVKQVKGVPLQKSKNKENEVELTNGTIIKGRERAQAEAHTINKVVKRRVSRVFHTEGNHGVSIVYRTAS